MRITSIDSQHDLAARPAKRLALWVGFVGGPIVWALQLQTSYTLVPIACSAHITWPIYASTLFYLAAAVAIGVIAVVQWRSAGADPAADHDAAERNRFMGIVGVMTSALFAFLILIQGIPALVFDPCQI